MTRMIRQRRKMMRKMVASSRDPIELLMKMRSRANDVVMIKPSITCENVTMKHVTS